MANTIYLLDISPVKLFKENYSIDAKYHTKHFNNAAYYDQIKPYEIAKYYKQKFQTNDSLYFQLVANFGPVEVLLVDCDGATIVSGTDTAISTGFYTAPFYAYGCNIDLSAVAAGTYFVKVKIGSGGSLTTLISEPLQVAEDHPGTILYEYTNSKNEFGAIFQNGETFSFRCEGYIQDFTPGSNDVVYEDEPANLTRLSAVPYRAFKLAIGNEEGVPDWVADRVNRIFACDDVLIDGKAFTRPQGSKMEKKSEEGYPMSGWLVELRESKARNGATIENDIALEDDVVVVYIADTSLFGLTGGTGTDAIILKVE
jgi:hypothetical protein